MNFFGLEISGFFEFSIAFLRLTTGKWKSFMGVDSEIFCFKLFTDSVSKFSKLFFVSFFPSSVFKASEVFFCDYWSIWCLHLSKIF